MYALAALSGAGVALVGPLGGGCGGSKGYDGESDNGGELRVLHIGIDGWNIGCLFE